MKKKSFVIIIVIILLFLLGGIYVVPRLIGRFSYSHERADLSQYFGTTDPSEAAVIVNHEKTDIRARVYEGVFYLPFSAVQELLNDRFYDGREDQTLLYTTPTAIITTMVGSSEVQSSDGTQQTEDYVISRYEGDVLYVALPYIRKYTNFVYQTFDSPNRMELITAEETVKAATVKKDTALRVKGGVKSEILEDLNKGNTVYVLEEMETWTKVQTQNAFIGYVENKRLEEAQGVSTAMPADADTTPWPQENRPHKICLAWHNVAGVAGNDTLSEMTAQAKGLNVVSPTWYSLSDNFGNIESRASASYVHQAHDMGLEVWPLINDIDHKDTISDYAILSHAQTRAAVINGLMKDAEQMGFDGINVDLEYIDEETGESYIQFIRELSVACHARGLVLSVDNYVPMGYNSQYHRAEQGRVCDYVIIMGYDEHGSFSEEAGSVASIDFVRGGIERTLQEVPANKVINAVPFYTRIWKAQNGALESHAMGMQQAADFMANHGMVPAWDEGTCQNYAEVTEGEIFYQIWMEDADSLSAKLGVMSTNQLAGVAAWKLGFETPQIWETVSAYLQE